MADRNDPAFLISVAERETGAAIVFASMMEADPAKVRGVVFVTALPNAYR